VSNVANGAVGRIFNPSGRIENPSHGPPLLAQLVEGLGQQRVRYCCWKRPSDLQRVLRGEGDLDLLVDCGHVQPFLVVAEGLGFRRAVRCSDPQERDGMHLYGLDPAGGELIHLHVSRGLLGEEGSGEGTDLTLEELALRHASRLEGPGPLADMPVVPGAVELIVRVLRTMLAYARRSDYPLLARRGEAMTAKVREVLARCPAAEARALLGRELPCLPPELFDECVEALRQPAAWRQRFRLARRLNAQLQAGWPGLSPRSPGTRPGASRTQPRPPGSLGRALTMVRATWERWAYGPGGTRQLASGGAVIVFVGPDACGKSTLVAETAAWLGKVFRVRRVHLGKPPSTWLTLVPNLAGRLLGRLVTQLREGDGRGAGFQAAGSRQVENLPHEAEEGGERRRGGLLHRLRAVLLAWDRRALARGLARQAARGWLVVCDRYPSAQVGAADSARFAVPPSPPTPLPQGARGGTETPLPSGERGRGEGGRLAAYLARLENALYRQVPPPAVVLRLTVPLAVAIQRNRERCKTGKESDAYVTRRHGAFVAPSFPNVPTVEVDTSMSQALTIHTVRRVLWQVLGGGSTQAAGGEVAPRRRGR
jgi:thymidylate kinase